jgi:8-oxo-dGTP pyrophosphatase MutT (NUDIX family)
LSRDPLPTWYFTLVIVRLGRRFLLVQEAKHGHTWYLPAGRVEPGETLAQAAHRETLEEAGIPIVLEGLLRLERVVREDASVRVRAMFVARPANDAPPKNVPDDESLGARWFTLDEVSRLPLRGDDVMELLGQVESGGPVYPLTLLPER